MKNSSLWIILHRMRMPFIVIIVTYSIAIIGFLLIEGIDDKGNPYHMSIFDAFYFITYTATTIGFGETPYDFTYPQKIWATFSIYLTVLGWFYGIGSLVSLLQDKLFISEIAKANFRRQIRVIRKKFIIVLGYNHITSEIIKKALGSDMRTVVIEKNQNKVNELMLENFTPSVPVLVADAHDPVALESAGITRSNCKAVVSLFEDDALNLRIALTSKILNKNIMLAVKSTTPNHTENLLDVGTEIIENPFTIIAYQIEMALKAPSLLRLEKWIYKLDTLEKHYHPFPKGKYIICGFGRMGKYIYDVLERNGIDSVFVEIDSSKASKLTKEELKHVVFGDGDDREKLLEAGIDKAAAVIAGTDDDTVNLSILATAKKVNPDIMTIARENEMEDFSIFANAKIDHIFMPSKILIYKTTNALINPSADKFVRLLTEQDQSWGQKLVRRLIEDINVDPEIFELCINQDEAIQIYNNITDNKDIYLNVFKYSLYNRSQKNNVVPLLIIREDETEILLPDWDEKLQIDDKILFACDENAKTDIEYIAQNIYELHYILTGTEKKFIWRRE